MRATRHDDAGAPADGAARFYRCVLAAEGAEPVVTEAVRGVSSAMAMYVGAIFSRVGDEVRRGFVAFDR